MILIDLSSYYLMNEHQQACTFKEIFLAAKDRKFFLLKSV